MTTKKHRLLLGAHMSIAGGLDKSIERGASIGCSTIQIFTKSNRQWSARKISDDQAAAFHQALKKTTIKSVITHATYLINIGSPDSATSKKSTAALIDELERCALLTIPFLVLHPGASLKSNEQECIERITQNINEALAKTPNTTTIQETDSFSINNSFSSPTRKIKIPMASLDETHSPKRIEEDRSFVIDSHVVRIMKSRKTMHHQNLISETLLQMQNFKPEPKQIKKRIENLIEREYLKRSDNDHNSYEYLA